MQLRTLLENNGFYRIPLKKLNTTHYLLYAKIHNKKARLILDTGASTTCINIHRASYFDIIHEESEIKLSGAGTSGVRTNFSHKNDLKIGSWKTQSIALVLFDLNHINISLSEVGEEAVDGILGADFLKKHRAIIDYGRNCLYLKNK